VLEESVDLIDVLSTPGPETGMVQAHTALHEPVGGVPLVATSDSHGSATPDVIDTVLTAEYTLEAQKGKQGFIELPTLLPLTHRQNDMRHAVDLDHDSLQTLSCHLSRPKFCISVPWEREGLAAHALSPPFTQLVAFPTISTTSSSCT